MSESLQTPTERQAVLAPLFAPARSNILQRKCDCGQHTIAGSCTSCNKENETKLQRSAKVVESDKQNDGAPPVAQEVLRSAGRPLDTATRAFFEPRFGHDFSRVRVHSDAQAAKSASAEKALAYTVGRNVVFAANEYSPATSEGRKLIAHELAHVVQQSAVAGGIGTATESDSERNADAISERALAGQPIGAIQRSATVMRRRAAPYIKKVSVHLAPPQSADLEWEGTPPAAATGSDHFTVSTGKGYSDPGDPAGTCTRTCCTDAMTQCAPPWNQPTRVGACCTYYGDSFWTGTPLEEHNGWQWWTPIQPYYSSRGIALHQHTEVTGDPIGHGCVRMDEPNAKRIFDYSNGRRTNVTIDGRAAPVLCDSARRCTGSTGSGATGLLDRGTEDRRLAQQQTPVAGLEGVMS